MYTTKPISVTTYLDSLQARLNTFIKNNNLNIVKYISDDIVEHNLAINANYIIALNFKNLQLKYFKYLENNKKNPIEQPTERELEAYSLAVNEEYKYLKSISFSFLDTKDDRFAKFLNKIELEIKQNTSCHDAFISLFSV